MNKNTLLWRSVLFFCLTLSALRAEEQTVILQVNESSPIWTEKLPLGGMGSEIVQAISKEMGMKTRIEFVPLKRLVADTTNNDVGNPLFYMNNQEFAAIIPIAVSYNSFFTYDNDANSATPKVKRIGVLKGALSNISLSKKFGSFEESYSHKSLFKKLKAGRLDLVLELDLVGREMISQLFPDESERFNAQVVLNSNSPIAIMIDVNYPNANAIGFRYQEGLDRIVKNGVYRKILEKYHENSLVLPRWQSDLSKYKAIYSMDFRENNL